MAHPARTDVRTYFVPTEFYTFSEWHYEKRRLKSLLCRHVE
jgi:hypothetical protein